MTPFLRRMKKLLMRSAGGRVRTFVSHAYADADRLHDLRKVARHRHRLVVFAPVVVSAREMVSGAFLATLRTCDALIHLDTEASRASPWVRLEIETAKRLGLQVLRFDVRDGRLAEDRTPAIRLPVFPSWARADTAVVSPLIDFMIKERAFDMPDELSAAPSVDFVADLEQALESRLQAGGFVLAFITRKALQSRWVEEEIRHALLRHPHQVLPVLLEDLDPSELDGLCLQDHVPMRLELSNGQVADMRQFDHLMVRLYLLIHGNVAEQPPSPCSGSGVA